MLSISFPIKVAIYIHIYIPQRQTAMPPAGLLGQWVLTKVNGLGKVFALLDPDHVGPVQMDWLWPLYIFILEISMMMFRSISVYDILL